jgi:hypothetical protein
VNISALRDAIKASLNQDLAASDDTSANDATPQFPFGSSAPAEQKPARDEDEDDDYEKDHSHRGH